MTAQDKEKWNAKYGSTDCLAGRDPADWLVLNTHHLSGQGKALDLAMGEGRNALYLATQGYEVLGVDISDAGVAQAKSLARRNQITIQTQVIDLDDYVIPENEFDLIACFYFLDRNLFPGIRKGLKPGGLLIYETFNVDYLHYSRFKKDWVLEPNELLNAFSGWRILNYREVDDPKEEKAYASLLARKEVNP